MLEATLIYIRIYREDLNLERNATSKVSQGSLIFTVDVVVHHFDIGIRCISLECTLGFKQNYKPCLQDQTVLRPNQSGTTLCFFKYIKREKTSLQKKYIDKFLESEHIN